MFDRHIHYQDYVARSLLREISQKLGALMTKDELTAALNAISDQLVKAAQEIETEIANAGATTDGTNEAVARLKAIAQSMDDMNTDAAPLTE